MSAREPGGFPAEEPRPQRDAPSARGILNAAPGLARIAFDAWMRTTEWTVRATAGAGVRVVRAAASGESATDLLQEAGAEARGFARQLLGLLDGEEHDEAPERAKSRRSAEQAVSLRDRGEELLRQSADVRYEEDAHPAYERILGELAPDEGRILRFLAMEGPQPVVDVRAGKPVVTVSSSLVAPGLSMIGQQAGCRYLDRVPAYLNNLYRLGLIWFSRESLEDPLRYQVLEAQPDVIEALARTGRGPGRSRTVRRSIHLTPFGEDFCQTCLPLHTGELDALPGTGLPPEREPPPEPGRPRI